MGGKASILTKLSDVWRCNSPKQVVGVDFGHVEEGGICADWMNVEVVLIPKNKHL